MTPFPIRSVLSRAFLPLFCILLLGGCHRNGSGQSVPNVPLAVAAAVLGGGPVLVDPLAARFLLGTILLRNTLAAGTANGDLRYRVDVPAGYEADETDVLLGPGQERAIAVYTTLVTAAVLTLTVYATYDSVFAEHAFPVTWQNVVATSTALTLVTLLASPQPILAQWFLGALLTRVGVATLHSSNSVPGRVPLAFCDIRMIGAVALFLTVAHMQQLFANTDGGTVAFPDGQGPNGYTVTAAPLQPLADGDHCMFWFATHEAIPLADPQRSMQLAFVMDADAQPANNYRASPSFPNDFFDGTDRWYELTYTPAGGWVLQCKVARAGSPITVVPSAARVVLQGDTCVLFVPRSEFTVANPPFRASIFWHLGDFGINPPHEWSGDPTPAVAEPLHAWQG